MKRTGQKRATVSFDEDVYRTLRMKAAATSSNVSELVNEAVREALGDDIEDLEAFDAREAEPDYDFEDAVRNLERRA